MDTRVVGGCVLSYEDREVIFEEDSIGNEVYIIESGKVEIRQRICGKSVVIMVLEKGDLFGETAMLDDTPRSATAIALGKTALIAFTMEELFLQMKDNLQFTIGLLQTITNRLQNSNFVLRSLISKIQEFSGGITESIFSEKRHLRIGEILVEMGFLTNSQLERYILKQKEIHILEYKHKLLGEILVESNIITREQLIKALAEQRLRLRSQPQ